MGKRTEKEFVDGEVRTGYDGRKGRPSTGSGVLRIKPTYSQLGKPLLNINLPEKAAELLGWEAGLFLVYYPTKSGELVLISQRLFMERSTKDYDSQWEPAVELPRGPKPGSPYERTVQAEKERAASIERVVAATKRDHERAKERLGRGLERAGKILPTTRGRR